MKTKKLNYLSCFSVEELGKAQALTFGGGAFSIFNYRPSDHDILNFGIILGSLIILGGLTYQIHGQMRKNQDLNLTMGPKIQELQDFMQQEIDKEHKYNVIVNQIEAINARNDQVDSAFNAVVKASKDFESQESTALKQLSGKQEELDGMLQCITSKHNELQNLHKNLKDEIWSKTSTRDVVINDCFEKVDKFKDALERLEDQVTNDKETVEECKKKINFCLLAYPQSNKMGVHKDIPTWDTVDERFVGSEQDLDRTNNSQNLPISEPQECELQKKKFKLKSCLKSPSLSNSVARANMNSSTTMEQPIVSQMMPRAKWDI